MHARHPCGELHEPFGRQWAVHLWPDVRRGGDDVIVPVGHVLVSAAGVRDEDQVVRLQDLHAPQAKVREVPGALTVKVTIMSASSITGYV